MSSRPPRADVSGLQLSQLRVLAAVFEERSVRLAADRLCLTPSAVSHALKGLRGALDDELFVRRQDGMHPTARALEIVPKLRDAMHLLNQALDVDVFDPLRSVRHFNIACLPFLATSLAPAIAARLDAQAPGLSIRLRSIDSAAAQDLRSGQLDLMIGPVERMPRWISHLTLVEERMVFAVRRGHPRGTGPLTLEELARLRHVEIQIANHDPGAGSVFRIDDDLEWAVTAIDRTLMSRAMEAKGLARQIAMIVPDTMNALAAAAASDMVALSVRRAAEDFARDHPLVLLDPPYDAPPMPLRMIWNMRQEDDAGHRWLRGVIVEHMRRAQDARDGAI